MTYRDFGRDFFRPTVDSRQKGLKTACPSVFCSVEGNSSMGASAIRLVNAYVWAYAFARAMERWLEQHAQ